MTCFSCSLQPNCTKTILQCVTQNLLFLSSFLIGMNSFFTAEIFSSWHSSHSFHNPLICSVLINPALSKTFSMHLKRPSSEKWSVWCPRCGHNPMCHACSNSCLSSLSCTHSTISPHVKDESRHLESLLLKDGWSRKVWKRKSSLSSSKHVVRWHTPKFKKEVRSLTQATALNKTMKSLHGDELRALDHHGKQ